nr:NADH-quinone oxidoreductase subunit N [uncultured Flavobacterium sp.]
MEILIAVAGLGIICLIAEIFNLRKAIVPVTVAGLLATLVYVGLKLTGKSAELFPGFGFDEEAMLNNMFVTTKFGLAFTGLFILITIFLVALTPEFQKNHKAKLSDFVAIKVFLLSGAIAMVNFGNLSMFFLGIEILSIALYVLAASEPKNLRSNEAGMKYFLMGSFASGFILFGIALIYGATKSFDMAYIATLNREELPLWFNMGTVLITIGLMFKVAAVPFHFWAPDVYEGSPALTTATMSTLAKVAAVATFFKLVIMLNPTMKGYLTTINVVAVLSMLVGNLIALRQTSVKRMLAFSGIAHAGYMLLAFQFVSITEAETNLFYYASAYALAGIAGFGVIIAVNQAKGSEEISAFNGLGKSHPALAAILTGSLLSMAGIPVFAGFFGKMMLFTQVLEKGTYLPQTSTATLTLVLLAVVASVISVGYYFKVIIAMYTKEADTETETKTFPMVYTVVAALAIVLNLVLSGIPAVISDLWK